MEQVRVIKKQLLMDLDKNEAPSNPRWIVDRVLLVDGVEKIMPDEIALTPEEVETHLSIAVARQAADIASDAQERDAIKAERDALQAEKDAALEAARV